MVDIVALLHGIRPHVTATAVRQVSRIIVARVTMTGRVTIGGALEAHEVGTWPTSLETTECAWRTPKPHTAPH